MKRYNIVHKALEKRRVKLEIIEVVNRNIDRFMTDGKEEHSWKVFELTQSEDVQPWIEDPKKISRIQPNLENLTKYLDGLPRPVRVLDVGCYGGYLYDYLTKFAFIDMSKFYYVGIDIQKSAIEAAKQIHSKDKNANFFVGDIFNIERDFQPNEFDVVCCYRVLIHIPFFEDAIRNLCHVASKFVHIAIVIGNEPSCVKYRETDLDTGHQSIYFIRTVTKKMIDDIANELGVEYQIISDYEIPIVHRCLPFLYRKEKIPYSTLILWKNREILPD